MQGGEQKKESVCSWVEQHGLLDEPRTCVTGFCMRMPNCYHRKVGSENQCSTPTSPSQASMKAP